MYLHDMATNTQLTKLFFLDSTAGIKRIASHELDHPIKVIRDNSMDDGLKEGQQEGSDFIFLSNRCKIFKDIFGGDLENVEFDIDWWNKRFDNREKNLVDRERGFIDGHFNLGWGRCGVNERTYVSQTKSPRFLLALPHMINKNTDVAYQKLGNIPDLVQTFCDEFIRENGEKLMPCKSRDDVFGAKLREATQQKHSRFEAYTIVRQSLDDEDGLVGTKRHVDGPNCKRVGYQTTCVFSFLCVWKEEKYRITFICYTRNSCGHWMNDNKIALHLREKIKDYIIQSNGDLRYEAWSLKDDMSHHKIREIDHIKKLVPPDESIGDLVYKRRNPDCEWDQNKDKNKSLEWTKHRYNDEKQNYRKKKSSKSKIIKVQEFVNRYGYVSSYAHGINCMSTNHKLD